MKIFSLINLILFSLQAFATGATSADLRNLVVEGTLEYGGSAISGDSVTVYAVVTDPSNQCILWAESQALTVNGGSLVMTIGGGGTSPTISTNFSTLDQAFGNSIVSNYSTTNCISSYQGMTSSVTTVGQITSISSNSNRNITILFNDTTRGSGVVTLGAIPIFGVPYATYAANAGSIGGNSIASTAPTATNQFLMWNNSASTWQPGSITAGTGISLIGTGTGSLTVSTTAGTVAGGGTGLSSATAGGVLYGASNSSYGFTAVGTTGQALLSGGTGTPTWGTLGTTSGGTGMSLNGAANGSLLIGNGTGVSLATLTQGTDVQITNGSGAITVGLNTTAASALATVTNASSNNTPNTLVLRDSSGNFTAGTVTTTTLNSTAVVAPQITATAVAATGALTLSSASSNNLVLSGGGDGNSPIYLNSGGSGTINFTGSGAVNISGSGGLISATDGKFNNVWVGAGGGNYNTRLGNLALSLVTGTGNTALGYQTMTSTTVGSANTAVGEYSLKVMTSATSNTAVGYQTLIQATGSNNTAVGASALAAVTSATGNTAIGNLALASYAVGNNNIAIGNSAGNSLAAGVTSSVILGGNSGSNVSSGQILLADGSGTERMRIDSSGRVGIANNSPAYALDIIGDVNASGCYRTAGTLAYGVCVSDMRLKEDIQDYTPGLKDILSVRLRSYKLNGLAGMPRTGQTEIGVIAQELEVNHPELIKTRMVQLHPEDKDKTEIKAVDYTKFSYMVLNAVKDLYKLWSDDSDAKTRDIASLQQQLDTVQTENAMLKQRLDNIERQLNGQ